jgi:hypothetical protein
LIRFGAGELLALMRRFNPACAVITIAVAVIGDTKTWQSPLIVALCSRTSTL